MTNEQILDRLYELASWLSRLSDIEEATNLLDQLRDRLHSSSVSVAFRLNGSPESIGVALAEMLAHNVSREQIEEMRSQLVTEMKP
ncbi:hypothetical protein ACQ4M3_08910 [Leptolyngbya sp. AN03gr2]|uniref:hypothetical protein n=1 Tax=unclassified Leptolyngbya TaxID=2650499 RepID=UPI003D31A58B